MNRWAVFTDLDGTLLDATTFDLEPARPMLDRLRDANVHVVPVTSKTFDEVEPLARERDELLVVAFRLSSIANSFHSLGGAVKTAEPIRRRLQRPAR